MSMALVHRGRRDIERPVSSSGTWPEWWPRLLDFEFDPNDWLRMEEFQDGDTLVLRAELPDVDVDKDVEVTVEDGMVRVHAHREAKSEHKDKKGYRSEFRYGDFDRRVALPPEANASDVRATYADGILEVRVPCPAPKPPQSTKITVEKQSKTSSN